MKKRKSAGKYNLFSSKLYFWAYDTYISSALATVFSYRDIRFCVCQGGFPEALVDLVMEINHPFHEIFAGFQVWGVFFEIEREMPSAFFAGECFCQGVQESGIFVPCLLGDTEGIRGGHAVQQDPRPIPPDFWTGVCFLGHSGFALNNI